MHSRPSIPLLDELVAAAWRAPEIELLDGWQLRYGYGLTGRANSVWPRRHAGRIALGEKIARAEAFYDERGVRPRFQLSPAAEPQALDEELGLRGYERGTDVLIETGAAGEVQDRTARGDAPPVLFAARPDKTWLGIWSTVRGFSRDRDGAALQILCGSEAETVFARVGGLGVGRAVDHDGWVTVTAMATLPEGRRRGVARAVLHALAGWSLARRAERMLLNVDGENAAARGLYEASGFVPAYSYWNRIAPA